MGGEGKGVVGGEDGWMDGWVRGEVGAWISI